MRILNRRVIAAVAGVATVAALLTTPTMAQAYSPSVGTLYAATQDELATANKTNSVLYPKAAQLPNGRLIAGFERSLGDPVGQTIPLYKSDDYGTSWQKLSDLASPAAMTAGTAREAQYAKYTSNWTNPYLYTLPEDIGSLKAGTLLLASLVSGQDEYYVEQKAADPNWTPVRDGDRRDLAIALYASTDGNGEQWEFVNIITEGGWSGAYSSSISSANTYAQVDPVWEPYLMAYQGTLVAYYTDEVDYIGFDPQTGVLERDPDWETAEDTVNQILAHRTWNGDPAVAWSAPVADEVGSTTVDSTGTSILGGGRPGMTNVVPTTDGKWLMTAEFGVAKISDDPLRFWDAPRVSLNGAYPSSNPVVITIPDPTDPSKWSLAFNAGDTGSRILVNASGSSTGAWLPYQTPIGAGYSRNLTYVPQTGRVVILRGTWGGSPITYSEVDLGHSQGAYYSLLNRKTGEVLSTAGNKTQDANLSGDVPDIITWANDPSNDTQRWHLQPKGSGVTLLNKAGGRAVGIWWGDASANQALTQWVDDDGSDKLWNLVPSSDGYVKLQSGKNAALYATGSGSGGQVTLGAAVDASSEPAADDAQEWLLVQEAPTATGLTALQSAPDLVEAESVQAGTSVSLDAAVDDPAGAKTHADVTGHVYALVGSADAVDLGTVTFDADEKASVTIPEDFAAADEVKIAVLFDASATMWDTVSVSTAASEVHTTTTVSSRCLAGRVVLTVTVTNDESVPATAQIATPYGSKTLASLAGGRSASAAFSSRATSIEAGTVTVTASATIDGSPATTTTEVGYSARNCS